MVYTFFCVIKKLFFCLSLKYLNIMCEILMAEIFLKFFLTFISLFSLIIYLVRFNSNDKGHFLTYVLTCVSNFTTYPALQ